MPPSLYKNYNIIIKIVTLVYILSTIIGKYYMSFIGYFYFTINNQEIRPFSNIRDSFKKIIITKDIITKHYNESGILIINIYDFLLDTNSLNY